jgi:hypothetical protein
MCTTGWYPVILAPIVTAGFLLSLYSSAGCEFIQLEIGFSPSNAAWNQSEADLGLFYYKETVREVNQANKYLKTFHESCVWYTDQFKEELIQEDRTWKVARIMALIAASASLLACLLLWCVVFFPVPINCLWPGVLLPASMVSLVAEGSKFLIFDIALCRSSVWFPAGEDSLPADAEECALGPSAMAGIAAGAVHLCGLLCICLKTPVKRQLDPVFGLFTASQEEYVEQTSKEDDVYEPYGGDGEAGAGEEEDPSILDDDLYTSGPSPTSMLGASTEGSTFASTAENTDDAAAAAGLSKSPPDTIQEEEPLKIVKEPSFLKNQPKLSSSRGVSESRLSVFSKIQGVVVEPAASEEREMIDKLVSDLDTSFQDPVFTTDDDTSP